MVGRLNWIDYAKGLIIVALVFGHSLSSGFNAGLPISRTFLSLSYATLANLIPLFFFLAGAFVPRSYESRSVRTFLAERAARLAYPYFVWSVLQASAETLFMGPRPGEGRFDALLAIPFQPFGQFWFLYALFWMPLIYALARQCGRWSSFVLVGISAALFLFPIMTPALALDMLSVHLVFFAAGALLSSFAVGDRQLPEIPGWATALIAGIFFGSSLYVYTHWLDASTAVAEHGTNRGWYLYFAIVGGIATVGCAQWLARHEWLGALQLVGKYSLQIFVAHMFCVVGFRIVVQKLVGTHNPFVIIPGGMAAALVAPIVLVWLTERYRLPNLFEFRKRRARPPAVARDEQALGSDG